MIPFDPPKEMVWLEITLHEGVVYGIATRPNIPSIHYAPYTLCRGDGAQIEYRDGNYSWLNRKFFNVGGQLGILRGKEIWSVKHEFESSPNDGAEPLYVAVNDQFTPGNYIRTDPTAIRWREFVEEVRKFVVEGNSRFITTDTHYACTGRIASVDIPILLGPTVASKYGLESKKLLRNHILVYTRSTGELRTYKLKFNPTSVIVSDDSLTLVACGHRNAMILDMEV